MKVYTNTPDFKKASYYNMGKPCAKELKEVFLIFHLHDLRDDLERWKDIALCACGSVYIECNAREQLILFTKELLKLVEAFYILIRKKHHKYLKSKLSGPALKAALHDSLPLHLSESDVKNPKQVIHLFTQTFKKPYARCELLDMLDAAMTYDGALPVYKGTMVLLYRLLDFMVRFSYTF